MISRDGSATSHRTLSGGASAKEEKEKEEKVETEESDEKLTGTMPSLIDYVLIYKNVDADRDETALEYKKLFEKMMKDDGLVLIYEICRDVTFIKIHCPFDRLCKEAERVRLEMPLKGCDIPSPEPTCCSHIWKRLRTDDEIDFVSGPFYMDRVHLYEGSENPATFFRTAIRSFLVHHILINLDMSKKLFASKSKRNQTVDERKHVDHARNDIVSRIGLPYLLLKNVYTDSFVPHDISAEDPYYLRLKRQSLDLYYARMPKLKTDSRHNLNKTWSQPFKFQPLWKIRNYFGEEIALYFAWQGTLITALWIPAILGLISFVYGIYLSLHDTLCYENQKRIYDINSVNLSNPNVHCHSGAAALRDSSHSMLDLFHKTFDNKLTPFISLAICIWSAVFLEFWKRTSATLSYEWDCDVYEEAEPDRPEFFGTTQILDPVTKQLTWVYPTSKRWRKYIISGLVVSGLICVVFISVCSITVIKVVLRNTFACVRKNASGVIVDYNDSDNNTVACLMWVSIAPALLNTVSILIFGYFYDTIARKLTYWENHRTSSDHKDALIVKLFAFQFVNTYTSLFYLAFFRPDDHNMQAKGLFGMGRQYTDTCERGTCMSLLSLQVLSLMIIKPSTKLLMDLGLPWLKGKYRLLRQSLKFKHGGKVQDENVMIDGSPESRPQSACSNSDNSNDSENFVEREYIKPKLHDFTLNEYSEKVIEFGYIVMFAASFPIAPLLLLIITFGDMRIDGKRLLWFNRRPVAFIATDIGMWFPILRFVSFCGVISNAFIVAFTSSFCEDFFEDSEITVSKRLFVVVIFEERYEVSRILEDNKLISNVSCFNCQQRAKSNSRESLWLPATKENTLFEQTPNSKSNNGRRTSDGATPDDGTRVSKMSMEESAGRPFNNVEDDRSNLIRNSFHKKVRSNEAF